MIAKIGKGENMIGAISYNQLKVIEGNGQVLFSNKLPEKQDGNYTTHYIYRYFEPYLLVNNKTEKPVRHISLNPDPIDKVSDEQFRNMAQQYMQEMGYGNQPFVVFKHTDIERTHIHIVTTCVELNGKKIPDSYDHTRSMEICRKLEQQYNLKPATEKSQLQNDSIFKPVDYTKGDIKSQIASVIRHLPKYYQYQGLGSYNALLSLFNITSFEVKDELNGQPRHGLTYFALNKSREKASNPFKASLFGKEAGLIQLQKYFKQSKVKMKYSPARAVLKNTIESAMYTASNEKGFKKQLLEQGINTLVRRNKEGRIYGITFIDHESRTVWNGSQISKNLSANVFNDRWNAQKVDRQNILHDKNPFAKTPPVNHDQHKEEETQIHEFFDFLDERQPNLENYDYGIIETIAGLLPETHAQDYEELAFAHKMKKKKKRKKKQ